MHCAGGGDENLEHPHPQDEISREQQGDHVSCRFSNLWLLINICDTVFAVAGFEGVGADTNDEVCDFECAWTARPGIFD